MSTLLPIYYQNALRILFLIQVQFYSLYEDRKTISTNCLTKEGGQSILILVVVAYDVIMQFGVMAGTGIRKLWNYILIQIDYWKSCQSVTSKTYLWIIFLSRNISYIAFHFSVLAGRKELVLARSEVRANIFPATTFQIPALSGGVGTGRTEQFYPWTCSENSCVLFKKYIILYSKSTKWCTAKFLIYLSPYSRCTDLGNFAPHPLRLRINYLLMYSPN